MWRGLSYVWIRKKFLDDLHAERFLFVIKRVCGCLYLGVLSRKKL
ncbi:hypothetical protein B4099_2059 [Heyndrickxia coagulans]|uniref:Uncharacterized protein n=1 Tax=Heyndrickxia coagulans TaxID=1398 RepID=A0A150KHG6_HEYCO|nr:hypothetical protein B4099_2059 [Heyndrickxia coagulans]